jgi:hypothetical protein
MTDAMAAGTATTLAEGLAHFEAAGYVGQFRATDAETVECLTCRTRSRAADLAIAEICRLEGASDPADMLAVVALTCPSCGTAGTLILNYGPAATAQDAGVLNELEDARARA